MVRAAVAAAAVVVAAGFGGATAHGQAQATPPAVAAAAYLVVGELDGRVLAARRSAERRPMASITKLMTALVAAERAPLDDVVVVPASATSIGESSVQLRPGQRITVRELLLGTLVPSANDAATALALHVGKGSIARFVAMMNGRARQLGLRDTSFRNPHGLDEPGHLSSARDVVSLLRASLEHPFIRRNAARAAAIVGGRAVKTTDRLVGTFEGLAGAKTGFTSGAGWSQVAAAERGPVRILAVVLGEPDAEQRDRDLAALLEWGFSRYVRVNAVDADRVYGSVRTGWDAPPVELVAPQSVVRTVAVGVPLVEHAVMPAVVALPVHEGQRIGEVQVRLEGEVVARSPLVARTSVDRPALVGRVRWYAGRAVDHVVSVF
jgi:D-alanyl-D-alanine carboxypeptidase (penicillin-binding protein 5/6)